jgi:cellulose synthase/poly-beta-1,6-N-acetylglucosamine synthase-like glycosyltransferase
MHAYVVFVFVYFLVFAAVHAGLLVLALIDVRRYRARLLHSSLRRTVRSPLAPPISIIAPAYNESVGIVDSVRSLLALEYPTHEVIVVNDGSTDSTIETLVETFDLERVDRPTPPFLEHKRVRAVYEPKARLNLLVIDKENGGKADSLNAGINFSRHPLFCAIDADSMLDQDALVKTVMPFVEDPERTVASGGIVRVANGSRIEHGRMVEPRLPRRAIPMFQIVEYLRAFFGARAGWSAINGLLIISGAFGLFRKDVVIEAGGYRTDTVGEDIELVLRIHRVMRRLKRPYRIVYVPDPVCWTEAPETTRVLRRQRRRWHQGSCETLLLHPGMIGNPRYRSVGLLSLPVLLVFEVLGPIIELSGYVVATIAALTGALNPATFAIFLLVAILYGLLLSIGSIALEDASLIWLDDVRLTTRPRWRALGRILGYAVLENFGYRQLVMVWRVEGFWQLARGGGWGAMERRGLAASGS